MRTPSGNEETPCPGVAWATTDSSGLAVVEVPPGIWAVRTVNPLHRITSPPERIHILPDQELTTSCTVACPSPAELLSGHVRDENGEAVGGVTVHALNDRGDLVDAATSDERGRFWLRRGELDAVQLTVPDVAARLPIRQGPWAFYGTSVELVCRRQPR